MTELIDDFVETFSDDEDKLDAIEELVEDLNYKKMEILHKKGNRERFKPRIMEKRKKFMLERKKRQIMLQEMKNGGPPDSVWEDKNVQSSGTELINNSGFNKWVFSAGGCGTNYVRKLVEVFRIKDRTIINPQNKNVITSVHLFQPPKIEDSDNFLAVYVFGDPYLSLASICRRIIAPTLNILAGKNIASDFVEKDPKKRRENALKDKDQNDGIKVIDFLNKYPYDVLRFKQHWENWANAKVDYPILFIKYEDLQKSFDEIKEKYGEKYDLSWRKLLKKEFIPRVCSLDKFSEEELKKLDDIYGDFRKNINSMPSYWLKEPEIKIEKKKSSED